PPARRAGPPPAPAARRGDDGGRGEPAPVARRRAGVGPGGDRRGAAAAELVGRHVRGRPRAVPRVPRWRPAAERPRGRPGEPHRAEGGPPRVRAPAGFARVAAPAGAGRLDHRPAEPADPAGARQPGLALPLRDGPGRDPERLRAYGGPALSPRA